MLFPSTLPFPGPFWAKLTGLWRVYHELRGDTPAILLRYHRKHGACLRVAPNELDFDSADVIDAIYKKGRSYVKSDFYDGFTAIKPNMFGGRDEDLHAI